MSFVLSASTGSAAPQNRRAADLVGPRPSGWPRPRKNRRISSSSVWPPSTFHSRPHGSFWQLLLGGRPA